MKVISRRVSKPNVSAVNQYNEINDSFLKGSPTQQNTQNKMGGIKCSLIAKDRF